MIKSLLIDFKGTYRDGNDYTFWYNVERSAKVSTDIHILNYGNVSKASCWCDVPNRRLYVNGVEGYFSMAGHTMTFVSVPDRTNDILDFLSTTSFSAQKSGNPIQFNSTAGTINELVVTLTPKQSGSGDPSPSNVRPISGATSVIVTRTGKNLFDASQIIGTPGWSISGDVYTGTPRDLSVRFDGNGFQIPPFIENTRYAISYYGNCNEEQVSNARFVIYYTDGTSETTPGVISGSPTYYAFTSSPNKTVSRIGFTYGRNVSTSISKIQVEIASAPTDYEPYRGQTVSVTLTDGADPLTVYGGTLDVVRGALNVTWAEIASYNDESIPGAWMSDRDVYVAGTLPTVGAQVVYELEAPVTYQVSPAQLSTLDGNNIVYTNGDKATINAIMKFEV